MANEEKKSVVTKIIDNIKEDAAAPNPDFEEFKDAKGLKAKAAVVGEHLVRDGKERRAQSRENYEEMLRQQREHINDLTKKSKP